MGEGHRGGALPVELTPLREAQHVEGKECGDGSRPQWVHAEQSSDPERPDAAPAFQGRRNDVAADQEEHHDAVAAGVELRHQLLPELRHIGVRGMVEHHDECGEPA